MDWLDRSNQRLETRGWDRTTGGKRNGWNGPIRD
jgi:hypothetical protein